jgi:hypothetical protein
MITELADSRQGAARTEREVASMGAPASGGNAIQLSVLTLGRPQCDGQLSLLDPVQRANPVYGTGELITRSVR